MIRSLRPGMLHFYRTRQQARWVGWTTALGGTAYIAALIDTVVDGKLSVERRVIFAAFFFVVASVIAWVGWRTATAGVGVEDDGVVVRNVLRSRYLKWDEIARFVVLPYGAYSMGYVELRSGQKLRAWGIQGRVRDLFPNSTWATAPIDELNEILAEHHAAQSARSIHELRRG